MDLEYKDQSGFELDLDRLPLNLLKMSAGVSLNRIYIFPALASGK